MQASIEWLRKKGLAGADKKAGRVAAEGAVAAYIHPGVVGVGSCHFKQEFTKPACKRNAGHLCFTMCASPYLQGPAWASCWR